MPGIPNGVVDNPQKKSLLELTYQVTEDNGVLRTLPALHKYWIKRESFTTYKSLITPCGQLLKDGELEEWLTNTKEFCDDLQYLLTRRHHIFWSYIVYNHNVLISLKTFLRNATPFYLDLTDFVPKSVVLNLQELILNLVIRVFDRLITDKESVDEWMPKVALGRMLHEKRIVTAPMLLELVVAIGDADHKNVETLQKILRSIYTINPQYKVDTQECLKFFKINFANVHKQAEFDGCAGAGGGVDTENFETPYDDVILFTLDTAYTLAAVLNILPEMATYCTEIRLAPSIAKFYNKTMALLYKNIYALNKDAKGLLWLADARYQFLKAFRLIANSYLEAVKTAPTNNYIPAENFLNLLAECLEENLFVTDYQLQYPIESDIAFIKEACKSLDISKYDFIEYAYQDQIESDDTVTEDGEDSEDQSDNNAIEKYDSAIPITDEKTPTAAPTPPTRDLDKDITVVLDMFPEMGTGFIRKLLQRYDNCEEAIAALLENNLPPDLVNANKTEPYIPPASEDRLFMETGIKHFNKYDGDKYDILSNDKPACIIKRGKGFPNAPKNANELLDDKKDLAEIRHRYAEYSLVVHEEPDDEKNDYDDEYDDSYEALVESESRRIVQSKELKNNLANVQEISESETEESDSNEIDNSENANDKRREFCENPAERRERYEAQRQAKWNAKGRQYGRNQDVVGVPKGKGQEDAVLKNRNKKEVNKSSRANHNRKAGAAFKRSKGMMG